MLTYNTSVLLRDEALSYWQRFMGFKLCSYINTTVWSASTSTRNEEIMHCAKQIQQNLWLLKFCFDCLRPENRFWFFTSVWRMYVCAWAFYYASLNGPGLSVRVCYFYGRFELKAIAFFFILFPLLFCIRVQMDRKMRKRTAHAPLGSNTSLGVFSPC